MSIYILYNTVIFLVGRCARAGKPGQAYSLVTRDEMCYLLDLHLFLGRPFSPVLKTPKSDDDNDGLFGIVPQVLLEEELGQLTGWYTSSIDVVCIIIVLCIDYYMFAVIIIIFLY